ncbi:hypothetical protein [Streptomyces sp. NPDC002952]|uniref:hypothetical protein n=1 Tax=Streptomyces sp. NPDC002952 TaxID=3364673 RepID=UPI003681FDC1
MLGPDHADTHRWRASLARFLAENGEAVEGVRLLRVLYAESQTFGWQRKDEARSIRTALVTALELNGDLQEALDLLEDEIEAERGTIYGVDENLGDYEMKRLQGGNAHRRHARRPSEQRAHGESRCGFAARL